MTDIQHDAPYQDVVHALKCIYRIEATEIMSFNSLFADMRGGTVKLTEPISSWDHVAQAAMGMNLVKANIEHGERITIDVLYTVAMGQSMLGRKEFICTLVSDKLWKEMKDRARWYLHDITREWVGLRRQHDEEWWANHLRKDIRTLRRWRNGHMDTRGALNVLDAWHDTIVSKLKEPMYSQGLIQYDA